MSKPIHISEVVKTVMEKLRKKNELMRGKERNG
ncbi:unnamed protein product, partial [marine sediment metagenome]